MTPPLAEEYLSAHPPPQGVDPAHWKIWLDTARDWLSQQFSEQDIAPLIHARSALVDCALQTLWHEYKLDATDNLALLAVGGYGRGELHPCSDIDVLILHRQHLEPESLSTFFQTLWDCGLKLAQSVRTTQQCRQDAREDVTLMTSWLEMRHLSGDEKLTTELERKLSRRDGPFRFPLWGREKFFHAKLAERKQRHEQFAGAAYLLEPNLKEGPGGLRDIHTLHWILKRHEFIKDASEFCSSEELDILKAGQHFLWRTRFALHDISRRAEERLRFDYQYRIAQRLGYGGENVNETIEAFMQDYYRTTRDINRLTEVLVQQYREQLSPAARHRPKPINECFQVLDGYLEMRANDSFLQHPQGLLELFLILQQHPEIQGVRAHTIRAIRTHLYLIDEDFRETKKHQALFLDILRQPKHVARELRRMHRYGVLSAYWPAFGLITGKMQYDLFHVYPVDEHILQVLTELRHIVQADDDEHQLFRELFLQFPKPELLYLASLFHDIGKGRDGDHSTLGADDADQFCRQHGLSEYDAGIVHWLVLHHLLLSMTAQKRDTSDPDVVREFAKAVGNGVRLRGLFLLTVADLRGTNPALWTPWRRALLERLYHATDRQLQRGTDRPADSTRRLRELKASAKSRLPTIPEATCEQFWDSLPERDLLHYTDDELAWQTECILGPSRHEKARAFVRHKGAHHCTEILIHEQQRSQLFVPITAALARLAVNVLYARITETKDHHVLRTFLVTDAEGLPIDEGFSIDELRHRLEKILQAPEHFVQPTLRRPSSREQHFSVPTEIEWVQRDNPPETRIHLSTSDHPGLLWTVSQALEERGAHIRQARITTLGAQAQDVFSITDQNADPIHDSQVLGKITETLRQRIEQLQSSSPEELSK